MLIAKDLFSIGISRVTYKAAQLFRRADVVLQTREDCMFLPGPV